MTSHWRICSSVALAVVLHGATVLGRVELRDSRDRRVRTGNDYSGVVVWLAAVGGTPHAPAPQRARIIQHNKTFTPHVLAVTVGSTVDFPNFDPIFHNAFSNYSGQLFDVGLYPPGTSRSVKFTREGVVRIFCNIHSSMSAVLLVLDSPYFAITGSDGVFMIQNVPPGEYKLQVFHERALQSTLDQLARRVTVGAEPVSLPPLAISESGYLPIPHNNKYGHEYGPEPDDHSVYPGARK
jgi:plastocyanin